MVSGFSTNARSADVIYLNGKVYTVNDTRTWAEAFAIQGDKFIHVGSNRSARALITPATEVVDLEGRMVMPGIQDLHAHPVEAGEQELFHCNFPYTLGMDEILNRVKTCIEKTPKGQWIRGGQWPTELMEADTVPHKSILDALTRNHPIYLGDASIHTA